MSAASFRRRIMHRLYESSKTQHELRSSFRPHLSKGFGNHLRRLIDDGDVLYDPDTFKYRLSEEARVMIMRRRSQAPSTTPVNLEAEREQLIIDMHGPHGLAVATVADDPVLHERLQVAIEKGLKPINLASVPKHRRAQAVEEALDAWHAATQGGPCGYCGTVERRFSYVARGYLDGDEVPGFSPRADGTMACGWCAEYLASHTREEFREAIFNAVAGTIGIPVVGQYRYGDERLIPFAHELPLITGQSYSGEPWAWFSGDLAEAIKERARTVVHRTRFVTTEAQVQIVAIPGIQTHVWSDVPSEPLRHMKPLADMKRDAEERAELAKRRNAPKKQTYFRAYASPDAQAAREAAGQQELMDWAKAEGLM